MRDARWWTSAACGAISLGLLWGVWELTAARGWSVSRVFPPPSRFVSDVASSGLRIGLGRQSATIWQSILASFLRVFAGLGLGFVAALLLGLAMSSSIWVKRFVFPIVRLMAPIAPIAWIPLALVLLGIGNQTAIFIVFMGVFFTLTIATVQAVENVPQHLRDAARSLGASGLQTWMLVVLPHALPTVFTILRLNFIAAWMAVLAAEMTGLQDGLGAIIMIGRNLFNNNLILFGMCLIGIAGFLGDLTLKTIQNRFFWWGGR